MEPPESRLLASLNYGLLSLRDALGHEARQSQGGEETCKRRVGVHRASRDNAIPLF